jgi:hypothetical protein
VTLIGYTMMGEQAGPKQLVRDVTLAEEAGGPRPASRCPRRNDGGRRKATLRRWVAAEGLVLMA